MWAVRPASLVEDRRVRADRRITIGVAPNPPGMERRNSAERRVPTSSPAHWRQSRVLPHAWRDGWLVFEATQDAAATRRLPDLPNDWETCPEARLRAYLARAAERRR